MRGGATIEAGTQFKSVFRFRERQGSDTKIRIAAAALDLVKQGMAEMVNDGCVAAVLGAMLAKDRSLTVITNNAAVVDAS